LAPLGLLRALGSDVYAATYDSLFTALTVQVVFWSVFIFFLVRIKHLSRKWLYTLAFCLVSIVVLTIGGCHVTSQEWDSDPPTTSE
jgi:hypothetical protein